MSTAANSPSDLTTQLQREVEELRERVGRLERKIPVSNGSRETIQGDACPSCSQGFASDQQVLKITEAIFGPGVRLEDNFDPLEPDRRWRVAVVAAGGPLAEALEKKRLWHRRMLAALGPDGVLSYTIRVNPESA